ncbi:serine hydrolase domain-containing protein [Verrucosispora sp. WMMD1129]|uniref:serine hydrolase domain-containing protein n=1 Tax=Verrucosispora sp. WMMD1129 TaxID=3016093 RepID=UPI00249A09C0|nr:serine hydrolase domain-containing protein [Verrucosispora sp. WMMD1129]WFE44101.1 serine hydrolase [Verrucosispora sp. WMMD1129]
MNVLQRGVAALLLALPGVDLGVGAGRSVEAAPAASSAVEPGRLDAFVTEQMDRAGVPGVAYAIVGSGGVEHQATFGADGDGEPITDATPFLWGSVAKPVTASLLVSMATAGELDLDARVTTYLPTFGMADEEARTITLRHLLSQTGGIPERMDLTDRYDVDRRPGDVIDALDNVHLAAGVGEKHLYSSVNYLLLGAVVEEITGRDFADVLRERLLAHAGMNTAIIEADDAADRLPPGHRYVFGEPRAFPSRFDPAGVSYGYLGGSLRDAVAFARANLDGSAVLSAEQRATLVRPVATTGDGRSYGLGWRTWPVFGSDQAMVWHSGAAPGYQAGIVVLPEQDRAVVVLQNAYGSFQENQLLDTSWGLASILSGAVPETHGNEPSYAALLSGLSLVCLLLLTAVAGSLWRVARPVAAGSRRRLLGLVAWLVALLLVGAGLLALPSYFGVTLGQVSLWAPDLAALLGAGLLLVAVLLLARAAVTVRIWRRAAELDPSTAPEAGVGSAGRIMFPEGGDA